MNGKFSWPHALEIVCFLFASCITSIQNLAHSFEFGSLNVYFTQIFPCTLHFHWNHIIDQNYISQNQLISELLPNLNAVMIQSFEDNATETTGVLMVRDFYLSSKLFNYSRYQGACLAHVLFPVGIEHFIFLFPNWDIFQEARYSSIPVFVRVIPQYFLAFFGDALNGPHLTIIPRQFEAVRVLLLTLMIPSLNIEATHVGIHTPTAAIYT